MHKTLIIGIGAAAMASFSYFNYRRFYPRAECLGDEKYNVSIKQHDIESDGHKLYGELIVPEGLSNPRLVICSHGFNGSYKYFRNYVGLALAKSGYAVYCYDFYGGSKHSRSGGTTMEMSVFDERKQLTDVIRHFVKENVAEIFLFGESQGAFVTALTAPEVQEYVSGVILYYPAFSIQDDMLRKYRTIEDIPEEMDWMGVRISRHYYEGFFAFDPYAAVSAYKGPVLIVHGDADRTVDVSYGRKAADCYENSEFVILSGEDHGFSARGKRKAAELTYAFLLKQRKG